MSLLLRSSPNVVDDEPGGRGLLPLAALEFESPSAAIIATQVPPLSRATNLLVFLLVVSMVVASGLIRIDKIVSASGKLVADTPNILLQPFDQSIVESIDARKGDIVRKGQVLARLNPTFSSADLTAMKDQVDLLSATVARLQAETSGTFYMPDPANPRAGLQASIVDQQSREYDSVQVGSLLNTLAARLEAETSGKIYIPDPANPHAELQASIFNRRSKEFNSSLQNYDQTINQLKLQIAGDDAQANYYRQRLRLAAKVEGLRQRLQDLQVGTLLNTLSARDARMNMESLLNQAESDSDQAGRKIAAQRAERESFVQHWDAQNLQDLADARRKLVQAQQDYAKAKLHNELVVLTAPRDAVVLSVANVSVGSVVTSAEPLIHLVPMDVHLSVEADISGIDSGYVRPGEAVTIKFDTLPYLQYGSARGVVRSVSADSFNPEATAQEGGATLPNRPRTLYYKGDITLDELMLHDTPPGFRLMPGMPVTADVKVGTRSVLGYFIAKILPVAYESMHEP